MKPTDKQEDELLQEIDGLLLRLCSKYEGASHPKVLIEAHRKEILAKVKEKGWKSPEEVAVEKIVSYQVGSVDQREWLEKDGWLKWNREKVAETLYKKSSHYEFGWLQVKHSQPIIAEIYYKQADHLHKILTGGD